MVDAIKSFLVEWKESARGYYEEKAHEMANTDYETFSKEHSRAQRETFRIAYNAELFEEFLNREVAKKEKKLIASIEKKAGKIVDATNLRIGHNGDINGTVIGEKKTVSVETIAAGGYNIQRFHFRMLVK